MNDWFVTICPRHRFLYCNFEKSAAVSCLEWWLRLSDVLGFYGAFLWHGSLVTIILSPIVLKQILGIRSGKRVRHHHFLEAHPHHSNLWGSWQVSKGKVLEFFWKGTQRAGSCWIVKRNYVLDHIIMFVYLYIVYIYTSHADFWNELRPCFDLI